MPAVIAFAQAITMRLPANIALTPARATLAGGFITVNCTASSTGMDVRP